DVVEELDQVLDDDHHLVGLLPPDLRLLPERRGLHEADRKRLLPASALRHAEIDSLARLERLNALGERGGMHEDLTAVVPGEETETLVGVVPLDLASRHRGDLVQTVVEDEWK